MMLLVCAVMGILSALVEQHNKVTGPGNAQRVPGRESIARLFWYS